MDGGPDRDGAPADASSLEDANENLVVEARSMVFVEEDVASPFEVGSAVGLRLGFVSYNEPQLCSGFIATPPPAAVFVTVVLLRTRGMPIEGVYTYGSPDRGLNGGSAGFGSDGLPMSSAPFPLAGGSLEVSDIQPFAISLSGSLILADGTEVSVALDATPCPLGSM